MNSEEVRLICFANLHFYKVLDFQGLFVFLGVKSTPHSPLHFFLDLMDLKARLYDYILKS